jgi:biopolymer transport protein ExbB/TolQ
MDLTQLSDVSQFAGDLCYLFLAADAFWGAYSIVMVWRRVAQLRFRREQDQDAFLNRWEEYVAAGDDVSARQTAGADSRVVSQLALSALDHADKSPAALRHYLADRYRRDVSADLEYRISWVNTVIKTAPMLGLFGTVLGMMSAFGKLGGQSKVGATGLAEDISLALITTAIGLAIAIPLSLCTASLNIRIRKMEDLVNLGLARILEIVDRTKRGGTKS